MLSSIVLIGLAAVGVTLLARNLTPVTIRVLKPIGCSFCMSFWPAFIFGLSHGLKYSNGWWDFFLNLTDTIILILAAMAFAFVVNKTIDLAGVHLD